MTHPLLPAVDELTDLRRTLADLRLRELELCDEIRASATEIGTTRVEGKTGMAVIETRQPRQLNIAKLPKKILNNPDMFVAVPQTHVLIWPKNNAPEMALAQVTAENIADISPLPDMENPAELSMPDSDSFSVEMRADVTPPAFDKAYETTLGDSLNANHDVDLSADVSAGLEMDQNDPANDISFENTDTLVDDTSVLGMTDLAAPDCSLDTPDFDAGVSLDNAELTLPEDTLDVSNDVVDLNDVITAPETDGLSSDVVDTALDDMPADSEFLSSDTTEIVTPVFDTAGTDAPLPTLDMPVLDPHDVARSVEEIAPPADLLATQYTDLQPMGDLTEEDLDAAVYAAEQGLPPAIDSNAVLSTEALQAEFDTRVENAASLVDEEPAPFMTRRIIGAPA